MAGRVAVDGLLPELRAQSVAITTKISVSVLTPAQTCSRAVGHPAGLNLGDRFAYACAKERGAGLLYKGGDFAQTDLGRVAMQNVF